MNILTQEGIPKANGHYSTAIEHGGIVYISGQLPLIAGTKECPNSIEEQCLLVLNRIEKIMLAAGSKKERILQVRIYVSDISLWDKVNAVYAAFFGTHKPCRVVIPCAGLHYGALVEMEATAAI